MIFNRVISHVCQTQTDDQQVSLHLQRTDNYYTQNLRMINTQLATVILIPVISHATVRHVTTGELSHVTVSY